MVQSHMNIEDKIISEIRSNNKLINKFGSAEQVEAYGKRLFQKIDLKDFKNNVEGVKKAMELGMALLGSLSVAKEFRQIKDSDLTPEQKIKNEAVLDMIAARISTPKDEVTGERYESAKEAAQTAGIIPNQNPNQPLKGYLVASAYDSRRAKNFFNLLKVIYPKSADNINRLQAEFKIDMISSKQQKEIEDELKKDNAQKNFDEFINKQKQLYPTSYGLANNIEELHHLSPSASPKPADNHLDGFQVAQNIPRPTKDFLAELALAYPDEPYTNILNNLKIHNFESNQNITPQLQQEIEKGMQKIKGFQVARNITRPTKEFMEELEKTYPDQYADGLRDLQKGIFPGVQLNLESPSLDPVSQKIFEQCIKNFQLIQHLKKRGISEEVIKKLPNAEERRWKKFPAGESITRPEAESVIIWCYKEQARLGPIGSVTQFKTRNTSDFLSDLEKKYPNQSATATLIPELNDKLEKAKKKGTISAGLQEEIELILKKNSGEKPFNFDEEVKSILNEMFPPKA